MTLDQCHYVCVCVCFHQASGGVCPFLLFQWCKGLSWCQYMGGALGPSEGGCTSSQPQARGAFPAQSLCAAQTKEPAQTTRGCSFSWSDDSFQFTKDSGQGSEKSGRLIRPYDFTLQRTRQKRSDTADSPGTAVPCWLGTSGRGAWSRQGTGPSCPVWAHRRKDW